MQNNSIQDSRPTHFLTLGNPSPGKPISTKPGAIYGRYSPDGRVWFEGRPVREWEFMATGTGVTGITVTVPNEMVIQVNHSASIDEQGQVKALSRMHLNLDGSPFVNAKSFRMETDFRRSVITIEAQTESGLVRMEIRAHVSLDALRIDIYDERQMPGELSVRFEEDAPLVALPSGTGLCVFHENPRVGPGINESNAHWLAGRTFGQIVESDIGCSVLCDGLRMTMSAAKHQALYIVGASERKGKDVFLKSMAKRMRQLAMVSRDEFVHSHEEWWRQFWSRSYFEPDVTKAEWIRYSAAFDLFRYYTACCTSERRETPTRFQIELFRYHLRQSENGWLTLGICSVEMYQSVFGTIRTGDWESLRGIFHFFKENLPFYRNQAQRIQGVQRGAYIGMVFKPWTNHPDEPVSQETIPNKPLLADKPYNGDNPAGPLFMLALACDYADLSGDRQFIDGTLQPLATEVMEYFRLRYPSREDGKIAFDPCNAGETWQNVRNPAEIVCTFRFVLPRLISVGEKHGWSENIIAQWNKMLAAAPDIPRGRLRFNPATPEVKPEILSGNLLVPAHDMSTCKPYVLHWSGSKDAWYSLNRQQTELFAIWPTKLVLRDNADRSAATESYSIRMWQHQWEGWSLDVVDAACLGLLDEVREWFGPYFDRTFVLPCGLARETSPENPGCPGIPEYPSLQGMGTGIIPVLEMLLQDYPDLLIILPCWDPTVKVRYALMSPYAGKVTVDYDPVHGAIVQTERPIRIEFGIGIAPAPRLLTNMTCT